MDLNYVLPCVNTYKFNDDLILYTVCTLLYIVSINFIGLGTEAGKLIELQLDQVIVLGGVS